MSEVEFSAALGTLSHRGPNGQGIYSDDLNNVVLGHTRLSIIDLSERGRQPLSNEDGSIWLTFNGEIYNFQSLRKALTKAGHQFRSNTDSEVIVHAYEQWGDDCVLKLEGMFAFGIWDSRRRRLFLARDRAGIKPLFVRTTKGSVTFASEPRALLALGSAAVNWRTIGRTLQYGYSTGRETVWEGVMRLPSAHFAVFDLQNQSYNERRYWSLPGTNRSLTAEAVEHELPLLLEKAVEKQLVSDVPLGVFLSGGVDSTLVSGLAVRKNPEIQTFTLGFRNASNSEHEEAGITARKIGSRHLMRWHDDIAGNAIEDVFNAYDEPIISSSLLPTFLVCRHAASHCKVMLSGDGGDEVFGGYRWYRLMQSRPTWYGLLLQMRGLLRSAGLLPVWPATCATWDEYYRMALNPRFNSSDLRALFPGLADCLDVQDEGVLYRSLRNRSDGRIRQWQILDWNSFLVDNNLTRMDRASMFHGMEVRVPLLDEGVVQFVMSLPEKVLFDPLKESKWLLRDQIAPWAPDNVVHRHKTGFSGAPTQFYGIKQMEETVGDGILVSSGLLDWRFAKKALSQPSTTVDLWSLFVLEKWAQRWMHFAPPQPQLLPEKSGLSVGE